MMDIQRGIPIEFDLRPAYYDDFHCLAEACRLSCCKGWRVTFDKKDYMSLKRQTGSPELNARMAHALHRIRNGALSETFYGEFRMGKDWDCPMHCEDGLCALQREKGHEALPWVCRIFPRGEKFCPSGYFERSLSPACEGVLALLWDLPEGLDFRSDPLPRDQQGVSAVPNGPLPPHFQEIRSQCIDILQDRRLALPQRILLMGLALKSLADGETDLARWAARVQTLGDQAAGGGLALAAGNEQLQMFLANNIRLICRLPILDDDFSTVTQELMDSLDIQTKEGSSRAVLSTAPYLEARARFQERFGDRDYFMENLMVALFFHLCLPALAPLPELWKSYVSFCNLYSAFRFLAVMSCRKGSAGDRDELFRLMVYASRRLINDGPLRGAVRDELFETGSATLAHMAILLSG